MLDLCRRLCYADLYTGRLPSGALLLDPLEGLGSPLLTPLSPRGLKSENGAIFRPLEV